MRNLKILICFTLIFNQIFFGVTAYANPLEGEVVYGNASIDNSIPKKTIVNQLSQKAIVHWKGFSIAADETTQFNQPNAASVVLNRVVGQNPSDIFGTLNANGRVFIINPNGVLFGPNAQVNVGGLVASSLNISDENFKNGKYLDPKTGKYKDGYLFEGGNFYNSVINQGKININEPGGFAALIGSKVDNRGTIYAPTSTVILASGNEVAVNLDSSGSVSAVIAKGTANQEIIIHSNVVLPNSDGTNIVLNKKSLGNIFNNLVNNTGTIEAKDVHVDSTGNVVLEGSISATSGGVSIKGDNININHSTITSVSDNGPANVRINYASGLNIVNSQLSAKSYDAPGEYAKSAEYAAINIEGKGIAQIKNSSLKADVDSHPLNTRFITGGAHVNINSSLDNNGKSGVILDNVKIESVVTGATALVTNSIKAQTNGDPSTGAIALINGTNITTKQDGVGFENLNLQGQVIRADNTSSITGSENLNLSAVGNIGSQTQPLNIDVQNVTANSSGKGDVALHAIKDLTLGGTFSDVKNVYKDVTANSGNLYLSAEGNILNKGKLEGQNINLSSKGSISGTDSSLIESSATTTISTANGIGSAAHNLNLNTSSINVQVTGVGDVNISNAKDVALTAKADQGSINFTNTGKIDANNVQASQDVNLTSSGGDINVGNIQALNSVKLNAVKGAITGVQNSLIQTPNLSLFAGQGIGNFSQALNLDVGTVDGLAQGDIFLHASKGITLGKYSQNNVTADSGDYTEITATNLASNNGIVSVQAVDDIVVNSVITPQGGVALVSDKGSIYAGNTVNFAAHGTSPTGLYVKGNNNLDGADYFNTSTVIKTPINKSTVPINGKAQFVGNKNAPLVGPITPVANNSTLAPNIIAGGASYFSASKGTIGVGQPSGAKDSGVEGQFVGIIRSGSANVLNPLGTTAVNIGGAPRGNIYYDDSSIFGNPQVQPAALNTGNHQVGGQGSLPTLKNPLGVFIEVLPNTKSAVLPGSISFQLLSPNIPTTIVKLDNGGGNVGTGGNIGNGGTTNTGLSANAGLPLNPSALLSHQIQGDKSFYIENQSNHLFRPIEVVAPSNVYAYHSLVDTDSSAIDNIKLESGAYDYIDGRIDISNALLPIIEDNDHKKEKKK